MSAEIPELGREGADASGSPREGSAPSSRKGKWTPEEEDYALRIAHYFSAGVLDIPDGTHLRAFLSSKLRCDRMRITKKARARALAARRARRRETPRRERASERLTRPRDRESRSGDH